MGFTTIKFWLFLLAVQAIYGAIPKKIRWLVLLAASYCFYGLWHWEYIFLLAGVTLVSYLAGRRMKTVSSARGRKLWLGAGLVTALGSLFIFKYFDYVLSLLRAYLSPALNQVSLLELAAPIGISFFTLQVFSYLVDVYRGQQPAEQNLGKFALFVSFFPQLVAGPITRAKVLLPQIEDLDGLKQENLTIGLFRILGGGVQKYVIADRLSILISEVQTSADPQVSLTSLGVLYLYSIYIYFDFAGYSNIALGVARLFGVRLAENFRQPYLALDAGDFWNRWHLSLSNWLRDYIFYPVMRWLRGNIRKPNALIVIIIPPLAAMLISGIWHGAGKNFVFWGLIHGVLLALSAGTTRWRKSVKAKAGRVGRTLFDAAQWFVTFMRFLSPGPSSGCPSRRGCATFPGYWHSSGGCQF